MTLEEFVRRGGVVEIHHYRFAITDRGQVIYPLRAGEIKAEAQLQILPKGGHTFVGIHVPELGLSTGGVSQCNLLDNFNRRLGRTIAFGRAWKRLQQILAQNDVSFPEELETQET